MTTYFPIVLPRPKMPHNAVATSLVGMGHILLENKKDCAADTNRCHSVIKAQ
jgi:hypothetical protein